MTYISTPRININEHYLMQGHHLKYDDARNLGFFFLDIQMRSRSLTQDSLCINPHHSPSLLSNKRKHVGVPFLIGQQGAELETKLAALSSHHPHRHHLYLRRAMRDGSQLCRCLGSRLGFSLARDTPRIHMRLEGQDGTRSEDQDGMRARLIPSTPRGYHHTSIHDSLLRTVRS